MEGPCARGGRGGDGENRQESHVPHPCEMRPVCEAISLQGTALSHPQKICDKACECLLTWDEVIPLGPSQGHACSSVVQRSALRGEFWGVT